MRVWDFTTMSSVIFISRSFARPANPRTRNSPGETRAKKTKAGGTDVVVTFRSVQQYRLPPFQGLTTGRRRFEVANGDVSHSETTTKSLYITTGPCSISNPGVR